MPTQTWVIFSLKVYMQNYKKKKEKRTTCNCKRSWNGKQGPVNRPWRKFSRRNTFSTETSSVRCPPRGNNLNILPENLPRNVWIPVVRMCMLIFTSIHRLFPPDLFEKFIDVGHYVRELNAYKPLVDKISTLTVNLRSLFLCAKHYSFISIRDISQRFRFTNQVPFKQF